MHCGYITRQLSYLAAKQGGRAELREASHYLVKWRQNKQKALQTELAFIA